MTHKRLSALTDKQFRQLADAMFAPIKKFSVKRINETEAEITMTTTWPSGDIEDTILFTEDGVHSHDISISNDDIRDYRQRLFAFGVHPLSQDNPYLRVKRKEEMTLADALAFCSVDKNYVFWLRKKGKKTRVPYLLGRNSLALGDIHVNRVAPYIDNEEDFRGMEFEVTDFEPKEH